MADHTMKLHTIWGYYPDDDAIELHSAVDQYTQENNWDFYAKQVAEARERFGAENVREVTVEVPWKPIHTSFDPPVVAAISATVSSPSASKESQ